LYAFVNGSKIDFGIGRCFHHFIKFDYWEYIGIYLLINDEMLLNLEHKKTFNYQSISEYVTS